MTKLQNLLARLDLLEDITRMLYSGEYDTDEFRMKQDIYEQWEAADEA